MIYYINQIDVEGNQSISTLGFWAFMQKRYLWSQRYENTDGSEMQLNPCYEYALSEPERLEKPLPQLGANLQSLDFQPGTLKTWPSSFGINFQLHKP